MLVWWTALKAHLGVEGHALVVLSMTRIGLNKLVIEKHGWLGNNIEQFSGIRKVWDLEGVDNEGFGVVYAISKSVGMDLFQLVHITFRLCVIIPLATSNLISIYNNSSRIWV